MRWTVHGERIVYDSPWVRLSLADVEIPGGERFEHHVIRAPRRSTGVVIVNDESELLLLWRHRFITDTWGWEIPAGVVEDGEEVEHAARREALEETGWEISEVTPLTTFCPMHGICDQYFHLFLARQATHRGAPTDFGEAERVEWVHTQTLRQAVLAGEVPDGLSLTAITYAMAFGAIEDR